jgi:hypothetical protein
LQTDGPKLKRKNGLVKELNGGAIANSNAKEDSIKSAAVSLVEGSQISKRHGLKYLQYELYFMQKKPLAAKSAGGLHDQISNFCNAKETDVDEQLPL